MLLIYPKLSFALIGFSDATFPELLPSGRALAMGNAYICKVDDSAAVLYNPAGLGSIRWFHFHLTNLYLEESKGWMDASSGGSVAAMGSNFSKGFSLDGIRQLMQTHTGSISHSRMGAMPNITSKYFSVGYLYSKTTRGTVGMEPGALFEYAERRDYGPYASLNFSLFGGIFKLGASYVRLQRSEVNDEGDANTEVKLENEDYKKGSMGYITVGTRLTLPIFFLPTFAAVIHNTSDTDFTQQSSTGKPDKIKKTMDVGFSLTPQIGKTTRIHLEVNLKDSQGAYSEVASSRKVTFGAELDFGRRVFLRYGYGDGFGSGGIGLRAKTLEFDLTSYAVDASSNEFRGQEDRRYVINLSSGF